MYPPSTPQAPLQNKNTKARYVAPTFFRNRILKAIARRARSTADVHEHHHKGISHQTHFRWWPTRNQQAKEPSRVQVWPQKVLNRTSGYKFRIAIECCFRNFSKAMGSMTSQPTTKNKRDSPKRCWFYKAFREECFITPFLTVHIKGVF